MGPGSEAIRRDMPRNRRWRGGKLERDAALREVVLGYLQCGWSPEQVAGRLAQAAGAPVIAHETSYRFIYGQLAPLPAAGQVETRLAGAQRRQPGCVHCPAPSPGRTAPDGGRPPNARSLGG